MTKDRYRPNGDFAAGARCDGGMPPASRNHLAPTGGDTPASTVASSLERPTATDTQKACRSSRRATGDRPGERRAFRPDRAARRFPAIATSFVRVLRRPVETAQYAADDYRQALAATKITPSMSRKGNCLGNAPMERFFHTLKVERVHHRIYATQAKARRDHVTYIEGFYNSLRLRSAIGYCSPVDMERMAA